VSGTLAACERSLARLQTEWLDCYLLHWRGEHPLEDTVEAFERLQSQRKIRSWGVSNFDVPDLEELWEIAGGDQIACNQVLYHLQERAIEHAVLPWCEEHGVAVVGYAPFGHGRFPGPRTRAGRVLQEIATCMKRLRVSWRCVFLLGGRRFSRYRRLRAPNTPRKMQGPETSQAERSRDRADR
jgi:diketogulonate reductase-like aldo/keto reductase